MMFTSAYASHSICGPSRTAMLAGICPSRYGDQFNIPNFHPELGVPASEVFFSKLLQQDGFYTGLVGKWHLGEGTQFQPNNHGFDEFYGFLSSGHKYFPEKYRELYKKEKQTGNQDIKPSL